MKPKAAGPIDVDAIALAVLQRLVSMASAATVGPYTTRRGCGPIGIPDRAWKRIAKQIGRKPYPSARWFVVERAAFESWQCSETAATTQAPANDSHEEWDVDAALAAAGLRKTK